MDDYEPKYEKTDFSPQARAWRATQGLICCDWHSYMVGDGCDICQPKPTVSEDQ